MKKEFVLIALLGGVGVSLACGPTDEEIHRMVQAEVTNNIELLQGPQGERGLQGPQVLKPYIEDNQVERGEIPAVLDTISVRELRVLDDEGSRLITLGQDGSEFPAIRLHGKLDSGRLDSVIYTFGEGDIVFYVGGGEMFVCIWGGRIDVCEQRDGLLHHIDQ